MNKIHNLHKVLSATVSPITKIIEGNKAWINTVKALAPSFFDLLKDNHNPEVFYIGCMDARLPVTLMTGQAPGKIFITRNVGNVASKNDYSLMAGIRYAVQALKVKHIVICGHQSCGGVTAASHAGTGGILPEVDDWIKPIIEIYEANKAELDAIPIESERIDRLSELNIQAQMQNVADLEILQKFPDVKIHGLFASLDGTPLKLVGSINVQLKAKL